jgi:hypothetical protein
VRRWLASAVATAVVVGAVGLVAHGGEQKAGVAGLNAPIGDGLVGSSGASRPVTASRPTVVGPLRDTRPRRPAWSGNRSPEEEAEDAVSPLLQPSGDVHDPAVQRYSASRQVPAPLLTFEGVSSDPQINRVPPPDTNGDVGPAHYMQWVNSSFAIYDKTTGARVFGPAVGNELFTGLPNCGRGRPGDPVVLYDQFAERWLGSQFVYAEDNRPNIMCVAVSRTSDPTGTWCTYEFLPNPGALILDYPKFGVWPSQNAYMQFSLGGHFVAYERDRMLNCDTARVAYREIPDEFSALPADADGDRPPPRNAPVPLVGMEQPSPGRPESTLRVLNARITWGTTPSISVVREYIRLATAPYDPSLCNGSRDCIPQPGTTQGLDALSTVLMHRLQYRNFGVWQTMVVSHTVDTGDDHAGVRWYRIDKIGSGRWRVADQGTYAPDAVNRWMPSVAMDKSGDMAIGYSVSDGSSVYPGIRYTGRLATDPWGQMKAENTIVTGTGTQLNPSGRWGDYAAMAVDPVDDCTFYFTSEYVQTTGRTTWQSRVGAFRFPSCGQAPSFPGCRVPRVVGLTLKRAKARIRARRCKVGRVRHIRARRTGRVLRQTPRPGTVRPRGTKVSLVVGRRGR